MGAPRRTVRSPVIVHYVGFFLIVIGCVTLGTALGLAAAVAALELAGGDARGGPFVFIGIAAMSGTGAGFLVGIAGAVLWLRSRQAHTP